MRTTDGGKEGRRFGGVLVSMGGSAGAEHQCYTAISVWPAEWSGLPVTINDGPRDVRYVRYSLRRRCRQRAWTEQNSTIQLAGRAQSRTWIGNGGQRNLGPNGSLVDIARSQDSVTPASWMDEDLRRFNRLLSEAFRIRKAKSELGSEGGGIYADESNRGAWGDLVGDKTDGKRLRVRCRLC